MSLDFGHGFGLVVRHVQVGGIVVVLGAGPHVGRFGLDVGHGAGLLFPQHADAVYLAVPHHLVEPGHVFGLFGVGCAVGLGLLGGVLVVARHGPQVAM